MFRNDLPKALSMKFKSEGKCRRMRCGSSPPGPQFLIAAGIATIRWS